MKRFRVETYDTVLLINRVFVVKAVNKASLLKALKENYPNSKVKDAEEIESKDNRKP